MIGIKKQTEIESFESENFVMRHVAQRIKVDYSSLIT